MLCRMFRWLPTLSIEENCFIGKDVFVGSGSRIKKNVYISNGTTVLEYFKSPESLFATPASVYLISDKFWQLIEDTSIDFNFYTKRFILMSVIVPTTLFWINDESKDSLNTIDYMKKCFKRSMKIGKIKNKIKETFSRFL